MLWIRQYSIYSSLLFVFWLQSSGIQADICGCCLENTQRQGYCYNIDCPASVVASRRQWREDHHQHNYRDVYQEHSYSRMLPNVGSLTPTDLQMGGQLMFRLQALSHNLKQFRNHGACHTPQENVPNPAQLSGLYNWSQNTETITSQDITSQLSTQGFFPQSIVVDGMLDNITPQLFIIEQLIVVSFSHDQIEEHLFVETNELGQVFAFTNMEEILDTVQLISNPNVLITDLFSDYDPDDPSHFITVRHFLPTHP